VGYIDSDVAQVGEIGIDTVSTSFFEDSGIDIDGDRDVSILIDLPKSGDGKDFSKVSIGSDSVYEIVNVKLKN
jgi:hypothetical protein